MLCKCLHATTDDTIKLYLIIAHRNINKLSYLRIFSFFLNCINFLLNLLYRVSLKSLHKTLPSVFRIKKVDLNKLTSLQMCLV